MAHLKLSSHTTELLRQDAPYRRQREAELTRQAHAERPELQAPEAVAMRARYDAAAEEEGTVEWHIVQIKEMVMLYARLLELSCLGAPIPEEDILAARQQCDQAAGQLQSESAALVAAQPLCSNGSLSSDVIQFTLAYASFVMDGAEALLQSEAGPAAAN